MKTSITHIAALIAIGSTACGPQPQGATEGVAEVDASLVRDGGDASDGGHVDGGRDVDGGGVVDGGGNTDGGHFADGAERVIPRVRVPVDVTRMPACTPGSDSGCLYQPALAPEVAEVVFSDDVSYTDVLGGRRVVPVAVYRPPGATRPRPLVLLSHGGSNGIVDATRALREWASILAAAGYVTISLAHRAYEYESADGGPSEYDRLCDAVGVPENDAGVPCGLKINWARPLDLEAVLAWVTDRVATNPEWAAAIDLGRIGHMGHSAGAGAGMMVGGVTRNFLCAQPFGMAQGSVVPCDAADLVSRRLPDIDAIVTFSPQGPGSDGFMTESYATLAVPMLMATGRQDGDVGEPANREALFPLLPAGPRWKVYLDDDGAQHGLFGGELDPCEREVSAQRCADLRGTLTSAALAFFDAHLRNRNAAVHWLDTADLSAVSGTLTRR
ncbi:MAG: hypothetical protein JNK82_16035 [Myxococcaceae bacterium]|nr:hypothetical protein [Myxococcaceae bacterium]